MLADAHFSATDGAYHFVNVFCWTYLRYHQHLPPIAHALNPSTHLNPTILKQCRHAHRASPPKAARVGMKNADESPTPQYRFSGAMERSASRAKQWKCAGAMTGPRQQSVAKPRRPAQSCGRGRRRPCRTLAADRAWPEIARAVGRRRGVGAAPEIYSPIP